MAHVRTALGTTEPFGLQIAGGDIYKGSVVHKFGFNPSIGTSFAPVSIGAVYQTPQAASATALRVKAGGNAADTAAGNGAREVTFQGLDETGALVSEAVATAGASASAATTTTFMRLFRAWVSESGTYATSATGSHTAAITIENGGGGTDWATISATAFPKAQTEIGAYSVPLGYTAYLFGVHVSVESTKTADIIFFQRENILESAAPYTAMREFLQLDAVADRVTIRFDHPHKFAALTDFGSMAAAAAAAAVSVDMEIVLIKD